MPHEHCDCFIRVIDCFIRVSRSCMQFLEGGGFAPNAPSWIRHLPQMPHPGSAIAMLQLLD